MTDNFHPVANAWPLISEAELDDLAADIAAHGLHNAIWRHQDGRIIDGRNRWLACQKAGVECPSC
jgi:ParB-like chromosome segregation protein Spo0J